MYSSMCIWALALCYKKKADVNEDRAKAYELEMVREGRGDKWWFKGGWGRFEDAECGVVDDEWGFDGEVGVSIIDGEM